MTESFLQFVWKFGQFNRNDLFAVSGESLEILKAGELNSNSGPDFNNAKLVVDNTLWVGNVEIHIKSSSWYEHGHQHDEAYDNVILHVVYENDCEVKRTNGTLIPCLILKNRINESTLHRYHEMMSDMWEIPCEKLIHIVTRPEVESWLDRLAVERLEFKYYSIETTLKETGYDWEESFYIHLARSFGFKVNALPFEMLARKTPLKLLLRQRNNLNLMEALLYGNAGLIPEDSNDTYVQKLKSDYLYLQHKYKLKEPLPKMWKFMRLRPANFPTLRIAQLVSVIFNHGQIFSEIIDCKNFESVCLLFRQEVSSFWKYHYGFTGNKIENPGIIGYDSLNLILINSVIPFLFSYGVYTDNEKLKAKAIEMLEDSSAENNTIIKFWKKLGIRAASGLDTQALIQLRTHYCDLKKCLYCNIGNKILSVRND
jgi:hypothetical protein